MDGFILLRGLHKRQPFFSFMRGLKDVRLNFQTDLISFRTDNNWKVVTGDLVFIPTSTPISSEDQKLEFDESFYIFPDFRPMFVILSFDDSYELWCSFLEPWLKYWNLIITTFFEVLKSSRKYYQKRITEPETKRFLGTILLLQQQKFSKEQDVQNPLAFS